MRYLRQTRDERDDLFAELAETPDFLAASFSALSEDERRQPGHGGTFSPVEHCWHLADLEREGYGLRIERLLRESEPLLPDFDGGRLAEERQYRTRSLIEGIATFREARRANLASLRSLGVELWSRGGSQEGVGPVALCDIPQMMAEHDRTHRAEIEAWGRGR